MKWRTLSEDGVAFVRQLTVESKSQFGRTGKMLRSLRALRDLREPSAIPQLINLLTDLDPAITAETATTLGSLFESIPDALLPTLDERIRADSYFCSYSGLPTLTPRELNRLHTGKDAWLSLGLTSCHASGYVRELAIERLDREVTSGREIPFLLLRLSDWVGAVRAAAERALARRLTDSNRNTYLENLPLILRLRNRSRAVISTALDSIHRLLQEDLRSLVSFALAAGDSVTRRAGLTLAWEAASVQDQSQQRILIEPLLNSKNPAARLQAACWLGNVKTDPTLSRQLLPKLLDDRFAALRRLALVWCATHEPQSHLAALHTALLDPSRKVREISQYYLPKAEVVNLRNFYREAISRRDERIMKAAIDGLGETGRSEDADLIAPLVDSPKIAIRKRALAALARIALQHHLEIFINALQDGSPGVSRQARIALESEAATIGRERLSAILANSRHIHVRLQTLSLVHRLSKWEQLPLLVEALGQNEGGIQDTAARFVRVWLEGFNRTHLQPTEAEIARLKTALAAYGNKLNRPIATELNALAESLR